MHKHIYIYTQTEHFCRYLKIYLSQKSMLNHHHKLNQTQQKKHSIWYFYIAILYLRISF